MTANDLKIKTFSLIEEYYPEESKLAEDEDIINKINGVINSVIMDLMRFRKINAYKEIEVKESDNKTILLKEIISDLYQIRSIHFDTVIDFYMPNDDIMILPDDFVGKFTIYYYKYPKLMTLEFETEEEYKNQDETFEFDLDLDVLEVAPYGIAADLLKLDMISNYGRYFNERYQELKQMIDSRRNAGIISITGGTDV